MQPTFLKSLSHFADPYLCQHDLAADFIAAYQEVESDPSLGKDARLARLEDLLASFEIEDTETSHES